MEAEKREGKLNTFLRDPIDRTSFDHHAVESFLRKANPTPNDLVVVHVAHIEHARSITSAKVCTCAELEEIEAPENYEALYWATDRADRYARTIRHFIKNKKPFTAILDVGPARCWYHDPVKERVLLSEYDRQNIEGIQKFGYGTGADFGNLLQFIDQTAHLEGDFVEIGCYYGSSSCTMVHYMSEIGLKKPFKFYDVFDGFNYPEAIESMDTFWKGTHVTDGVDSVTERILQRTNNPLMIQVIQRNVCEENPLREVEKIAFANIDVDIYEAVYAALHEVHKKIVKNGIIVVEDAGHTPMLIGALGALNQFLEEVDSTDYIKLQFESGQYILIRVNN